MTEQNRPPQADERTVHAAWRALHSYFIDSVVAQDEEVGQSILTRVGGPGFIPFYDSIRAGHVLRVVSGRGELAEIEYRVEILTDHEGWRVVTRPIASAIGFDPDVVGPVEDALWDDRARRELGLDQ